MNQFYVMVPGKAEPQLFTLDELVAQLRSGQLPATADTVRAGESKWTPAKDIAEISAKLAEPPSLAGAPSPLLSTNLSPLTPPPVTTSEAGAPSPLGSPAGQTSPMFGASPSQAGGMPSANPFAQPPLPTQPQQPLVARKSPVDRLKQVPKGALIGGGAALGVVLLGVIALVWYRNSYSHGLVLEHVPEDCATLVYVDVEGIGTSAPVKPFLEKGMKNAKDLAQDTTKSHRDKERMDEVLDALKSNGIEATSVREIAVCIRAGDDKTKPLNFEENGLIVIGGTFRKGNPLGAIKDAIEAWTGKDDLCKIEDDDIKLLKCSLDKGEKRAPFYAGLLEGRVLAVSGDKKLLKSVRTAKNMAKTYGASKGENFVYYKSKDAMSYDGSYGDVKLKVGSNDTILAVETYYDADKGKAKLAEIKDPDAFVKNKEAAQKNAAKVCFKDPWDMLGDAIESGKVEAFEDGVKYEYKFSNKDLTSAMKILADAELKDLESFGDLASCVTRTVESPTAAMPGSPPSFGYE